MAAKYYGEKRFTRLRRDMVRQQILPRHIRDPRVIDQMLAVPRHVFVLPELLDRSYEDSALPIEEKQTISQPYIVALMSERLEVSESHRVLEIGTGSGYQTAVVAGLAARVYTVEILPRLYQRARGVLEMLGYRNVRFRLGDGTFGWPDQAPFDRILVTAAPASLPRALLDQLAPGGRMVLPIGMSEQSLTIIKKCTSGELKISQGARVRFVPMTGVAEQSN